MTSEKMFGETVFSLRAGDFVRLNSDVEMHDGRLACELRRLVTLVEGLIVRRNKNIGAKYERTVFFL